MLTSPTVHLADFTAFSDDEVLAIARFYFHLLRNGNDSTFFLSPADCKRLLLLADPMFPVERLVLTDAPDGFAVKDYLAKSGKDSAVFCYAARQDWCRSLHELSSGKILFHLQPRALYRENKLRFPVLRSLFGFHGPQERALRGYFDGNRICLGKTDERSEKEAFAWIGRQLPEMDTSADCFNLFYAAGEWADRKELQSLFRAFYPFRKKSGINAKLYLQLHAGSQRLVHALIRRYRLHNAVIVLPELQEEQKYALISKADVVLSLPARQKFSRTILNSMLIGKPVVINSYHVNAGMTRRSGKVFVVDEKEGRELLELLNQLYWEKRTGHLKPMMPHEERRLYASWIWKLVSRNELAF